LSELLYATPKLSNLLIFLTGRLKGVNKAFCKSSDAVLFQFGLSNYFRSNKSSKEAEAFLSN